jgi:hypothetical protein
MRRRTIAAFGAGLACLTCVACAALLGPDDVGYVGSEAGVGPETSAADAPGAVDVGSSTHFCQTVDATVCADFDEDDLTSGYVRGVFGRGLFVPETAGDPGYARVDGGTSPPFAFLSTTPALDAGGHTDLRMHYDANGAFKHALITLRVRPDALTSTGTATFLRIEVPGPVTHCNAYYGVTPGEGTSFDSDCGQQRSEPSLAPVPGHWGTFVLEVHISARSPSSDQVQITLSDDGTRIADVVNVVDTRSGTFRLLIGTEAFGPASATSVAFDDVVAEFD